MSYHEILFHARKKKDFISSSDYKLVLHSANNPSTEICNTWSVKPQERAAGPADKCINGNIIKINRKRWGNISGLRPLFHSSSPWVLTVIDHGLIYVCSPSIPHQGLKIKKFYTHHPQLKIMALQVKIKLFQNNFIRNVKSDSKYEHFYWIWSVAPPAFKPLGYTFDTRE